MDRHAGNRVPNSLDHPRVVGSGIPAAHAAEHAVIARLERQVEMGQRARRAVDPGQEQVVVQVLGLDGAEADPLHGRLGQDPPDQAGQGQGAPDVRAAGARLGPAAIVGADVDPGQHDLPVAGGQCPPHVGQHDAGRERPLVAAGARDDAVGAVERTAVLDLDEGPGALDRRAVIGDAVDVAGRDSLDARQRGQRGIERGVRTGFAVLAAAADPQQRAELREERGLVLVPHQARRAVHDRERRRVHLDRAARHDDLRGGVRATGAPHGGPGLLVRGGGDGAGVDEVQVRGRVRVDQRDAGLAQEPGGGLHLGLVDLAAEVDDGSRPWAGRGPGKAGVDSTHPGFDAHHRTGFVDMRNAMSPTAEVMP